MVNNHSNGIGLEYKKLRLPLLTIILVIVISLMTIPAFATSAPHILGRTVVIGQSPFTTSTSATTQTSLNQPQGIAYDSAGNKWVADTANNRVLEFTTPFTTGEQATVVIGQSGFTSSSANNGGISASTLNNPSSLAFDSSGNLWVADTANNRVLEFTTPFTTGESASIELGQADFISSIVNNEGISPVGLNGPSSLAFDSSGNLWVADRNNNRVLEYPKSSLGTNGAAATVELGQPIGTAFTSNTANNGVISASTLNNPYSLAFDSSGNLWVADGNNNRVLEYPKSSLGTNGAAATVELGQPSSSAFTTNGVNQGGISASSLNAPEGLAFDSSGNLWVADTGNNRVLEFTSAFTNGKSASYVIGQPDFGSSSSATTQSGLSNPRHVAFDTSGNLWVADSNNNRLVEFTSAFTNGMNAAIVIGQSSFTTGTSATTQSGLNQPRGIAYDSAGNKWVTDTKNNRVLEFTTPFTTGESASIVLGQSSGSTAFTSNTVNNGGISASSLNGPSSLAFDSSGNLWVADGNNNRVLEYPVSSLGTNGAAATVELGQPSGTAFTSNTANNGGLSASTLNNATGLAFDSSGNLWVADHYNNRILMYPKSSLGTNGAAATVELGQPSGTAFTSNTANNGGISASTLYKPSSLAFDSSGNLWVADRNNNRVLEYPKSSLGTNGAAATVELGQPSGTAFTSNTANNGGLSASTLNNATGLAFDSSGNLWVADSNNNRLVEFSPPFNINGLNAVQVLGQSAFTTGTPATTQGGLSNPHVIAFDASGNLWVADSNNNRLVEFTSTFANGMNAVQVLGQSAFTTSTSVASQTGLSTPSDIVLDSAGNMWVSDVNNKRVLEFQRPFTTGEQASIVIGQSSFTTSSSGTSQNTIHPDSRGIAFDSSGNLWVADALNNRILEFTPPFSNGMNAALELGQPAGGTQFTSKTSATTQSGFFHAEGITFDSSGNLWVADTKNNRILEFTPPFSNGMNAALELGQPAGGTQFTSSSSATTQSGLNQPQGVAFDSSGNLWVADTGNNRVLEFTSAFTNGKSASYVIGQSSFTTATNTPTTQTSISSPLGVFIDPANDILVADNGNNRILLFPPIGSSTPNGEPAAMVVGQSDYVSSSSATSQNRLNGPTSVVFIRGQSFIADSVNNRITVQQINPPQPITLIPGDGSAAVSWNPPNAGGLQITDYKVFYRSTGSGPFTPIDTASTSTSYTVTGLTNGNSYDFEVVALATGYNATSPLATLSSGAPTSLQATIGSNGQVTLSWTAPSVGTVTDYKVLYSTTGSGSFTTVDTTSTSTSYTFTTGLATGTSYDFEVTAVTSGYSATSTVLSGITPGTPSAPSITNLTPSAGSMTLSWTAPSSTGGSAITDYLVYFRPFGSPVFNKIDTSSTATSFTVSPLLQGQSFEFEVQAVNANGNGIASTISSGTPSSLTGGALSQNAPQLSTTQVQNIQSLSGKVVTGNSQNNIHSTSDLPSSLTVPLSNRKLLLGEANNLGTIELPVNIPLGKGPDKIINSFNIPPYSVPSSASIAAFVPTAVTPESNGAQTIATPQIAIVPGQNLIFPVQQSVIPKFGGIKLINLTSASTISSNGEYFTPQISNQPFVSATATVPKSLARSSVVFANIGTQFDATNSGVNWDNPSSFKNSPQITFTLPIDPNLVTLPNGCPQAQGYTLDTNNNKWVTLGPSSILSVTPTPGSSTTCDVVVQVPHFSSFAVGGIAPALAVGSAAFGPPTLSGPAFLTNEYGLSIDENNFKLVGHATKINPASINTGTQATLNLLFFAPLGPDTVQHASLFLNLYSNSSTVLDSDTALIWDRGTKFQAVDPHGFFFNSSATAQTVGDKLQVTFNMIFAKPMKTTDLIIRAWNNDAASYDTEVVNAFQVVGNPISSGPSIANNSDILSQKSITTANSFNTPSLSQPPNIPNSISASNPALMNEIKEWSGYSSTSISDSQLLEAVGLKGTHIPPWFMNKTSKWFVNGDASEEEFVSAIKYMYDKGIIK